MTVRGYCHKCDQEVDCEPTDTGDFHCLTCNSSGYVESDAGASPHPAAHPAASNGHARGAGDAGLPPMLRNGEAMASAFRHFLQGVAGGLQEPGPGLDGIQRTVVGAVNNGVQRVIHNTQGLSEEDRMWIQQQGNQMTIIASGGINILRHAGPLAVFLEQHLGRNWQQQQSGLDEGTISRWLDERQIPIDSVLPNSGCPLGLKPNETWSCSICLTGCTEDAPGNGGSESAQTDQEICLLCDSDGHTWHVFHKSCAKEWLQRSATCPLCRRNLHITQAR